MKKFSFDFLIVIIFSLCEILFLLFGIFNILTVNISFILSLVLIFLVIILWIKEYLNKKPSLLLNKENLFRAFFIFSFGTLFLITVLMVLGGVNSIVLPCFVIGFILILFSTLESIGFLKTHINQQELDCINTGSNLLNIIRLLAILWAFIPFLIGVIYSYYPLSFEFFKNIEFPFSQPSMAISDKDGNIYVDTGFYSRIQKYDKNGKFLYGFGYGKKGASEVIIDHDGKIYIGSYDINNILKVYSSDGVKIKEYSAPGEDLTSWYLNKTGEVELVFNQSINIGEIAMPVLKGTYIFKSTKFYRKIFQDNKGNRYITVKNILYPNVFRENINGKKELVISPGIVSYLFTVPFPSFIIPLFILCLTELIISKKGRNKNE